MKIFLDFETRSECDLRRCGQSVYARDPSTTALCLAYGPHGKQPRLWRAGEALPADLAAWLDDPLTEFHAHNAAFEKAIWQHVMVARCHWPPIRERQWHCTAARAAALALPRSLEGAGGALGLPIKKNMEGRKAMLKLSKPRKPTKNNPETWHNGADDFATLYDYCQTDVVAEMAIHDATADLHGRERLTWLLDQRINDRGIPIDRKSVESAIAINEQHKARLTAELNELTGGEVETARQVEKFITWLAKNYVNVGDLTKATVESQLAGDSLPSGKTRRALEIRLELGKSSISKYEAMRDRMDGDDRIRGAHLYQGATPTGRWAGVGVQFQNMPSRGGFTPGEIPVAVEAINTGSADVLAMLYGDVAAPLSRSLRPMVKAPAGRRLLVCDFAGIENRVLAWLAAETKLLDLLRTGGDPYKAMAGEIFGIPAASVTKDQRQLGKVAILGLGYQMGWQRFMESAAAPPYYLSVDEETAQTVVPIYRKAHSRIVRFWYGLNDACIEVVKTGNRRAINKLKIFVAGRYLFIRLPSGRRMAYVDPQVRLEQTKWGKKEQLSYMAVDQKTKRWMRERTYGGKLVENVVQAVARDFLVDAMFRLERNGYPVIFHVHDEAVCELPYGQGSIGEMEELMSELPEWGSGCPIGAEGFESERYRK